MEQTNQGHYPEAGDRSYQGEPPSTQQPLCKGSCLSGKNNRSGKSQWEYEKGQRLDQVTILRKLHCHDTGSCD